MKFAKRIAMLCFVLMLMFGLNAFLTGCTEKHYHNDPVAPVVPTPEEPEEPAVGQQVFVDLQAGWMDVIITIRQSYFIDVSNVVQIAPQGTTWKLYSMRESYKDVGGCSPKGSLCNNAIVGWGVTQNVDGGRVLFYLQNPAQSFGDPDKWTQDVFVIRKHGGSDELMYPFDAARNPYLFYDELGNTYIIGVRWYYDHVEPIPASEAPDWFKNSPEHWEWSLFMKD